MSLKKPLTPPSRFSPAWAVCSLSSMSSELNPDCSSSLRVARASSSLAYTPMIVTSMTASFPRFVVLPEAGHRDLLAAKDRLFGHARVRGRARDPNFFLQPDLAVDDQ